MALPALPAPAASSAGLPDLLVGEDDTALIWDLVRGVTDAQAVLARYSMTRADFETKGRQPLFARSFRMAKRYWDADGNVRERIKVKAQAALEESVVSVARIVNDPDMSVPAKLEAVDRLDKLADIHGKRAGTTGAEAQKVSITINLGDNQPVVVNAEVIPGETSDE